MVVIQYQCFCPHNSQSLAQLSTLRDKSVSFYWLRASAAQKWFYHRQATGSYDSNNCPDSQSCYGCT